MMCGTFLLKSIDANRTLPKSEDLRGMGGKANGSQLTHQRLPTSDHFFASHNRRQPQIRGSELRLHQLQFLQWCQRLGSYDLSQLISKKSLNGLSKASFQCNIGFLISVKLSWLWHFSISAHYGRDPLESTLLCKLQNLPGQLEDAKINKNE